MDLSALMFIPTFAPTSKTFFGKGLTLLSALEKKLMLDASRFSDMFLAMYSSQKFPDQKLLCSDKGLIN